MSLNLKSKKFEVTYISLEPLDKTSVRKKLAYPIKHHEFAYYTTQILDEIPKKIPENIIRYLVVKIDKMSEVAEVESEIRTKTTKTKKIKIEELDKKLDEILKE